nr:PREDICTED: UPF0524 protein C3orf70 homolog [Equus przewalskii]
MQPFVSREYLMEENGEDVHCVLECPSMRDDGHYFIIIITKAGLQPRPSLGLAVVAAVRHEARGWGSGSQGLKWGRAGRFRLTCGHPGGVRACARARASEGCLCPEPGKACAREDVRRAWGAAVCARTPRGQGRRDQPRERLGARALGVPSPPWSVDVCVPSRDDPARKEVCVGSVRVSWGAWECQAAEACVCPQRPSIGRGRSPSTERACGRDSLAVRGGRADDRARPQAGDEAQALARSCAARRPDFQPCDGLSICATHSHGKCFKLHWCCHLGWCHCKYVYQPMTPVEQLPSTEIPAQPREPTNTIQISVSLTEHFLKFASVFQPPLPPDSPRYCMISDLFIDNYQVKCINGKMCYVQKQPAPHSHKTSPEEVSAHDALISKESNTPKIDHCSSPSSSEDSGINAIGAHYVESCDEDTEEGAELSSEEDYSPESSWEPDECTLLSPSQSDLEVIETIETTV